MPPTVHIICNFIISSADLNLTDIGGISVRFRLTGNLDDKEYTCKLTVRGQSDVENMTEASKNMRNQEFTGLKPGTEYQITCTQKTGMNRITSKPFRTLNIGMSGHVTTGSIPIKFTSDKYTCIQR